MEIFSFLSIVQIVLVNTLLFTIGVILRRNRVLLEYFGIDSGSDKPEIIDLRGLITFSGKLLQYIAVLTLITQVLGIFAISSNSF